MPGKTRRLVAVAAASVVVGGAAGCAGTSAVDQSVNGGGFQQGDYSSHYSPGHRRTVGDVSGETLQGDRISLSSYRGKVVVVNFWASNCAPCALEAPWLEDLSKTYASKGVRFVGIDERDNRAAALAFERNHHVTYPSIFDSSDAFVLDFPGSAPSTTPFTIVIDRAGGIAAKTSVIEDYTHLRALVDSVLADDA
jgi:thiol-disulfide isomerase/thioredoxin